MAMSFAQQLYLDQTHAAFCYVVLIGKDAVGAFTECTLPTIEWEVEEIKEGGQNAYTHQLPGRRKGARLTLKNGIGKSVILDWFKEVADADVHQEKLRRTISVQLKNSELKEVCTWTLEKAVPVKWAGPQLRSDASAVAIQTLEFVCGAVTMSMP